MKNMKQIFPLLLMAILLSAALPVTESSWYRSNYAGPGFVLPPVGQITDITLQSFTAISNGFYTLSGNIFSTTYAGLVNVSGSCTQSKAQRVHLWITFQVNGQTVALAETDADTFAFSAAFVAGNFFISGMKDFDNPDTLWCDILIEKVK